MVTHDADTKKKNDLLQKALEIAVHVHRDQVDFSGEPIIFHVLRVYSKMTTTEEKLVALLHDVVEDSVNEDNDKSSILSQLSDIFPEEVVKAVDYLTHTKGEEYISIYVKRIVGSRLASVVKLADLEDNMNTDRLPPGFIDKFSKRMERYKKAKGIIIDSLNHHSSVAITSGQLARVILG